MELLFVVVGLFFVEGFSFLFDVMTSFSPADFGDSTDVSLLLG